MPRVIQNRLIKNWFILSYLSHWLYIGFLLYSFLKSKTIGKPSNLNIKPTYWKTSLHKVFPYGHIRLLAIPPCCGQYVTRLQKHAVSPSAEKLVLGPCTMHDGTQVLYPSRRKLGTNEKTFVIKSSYWILTCPLLAIKRRWAVMGIIIEFVKCFAAFNEVMDIVSALD